MWHWRNWGIALNFRAGQTAVFDGITDKECNPYRLKLESVEQWEAGIVWLRYKMRGQKQ